MGILRVLLAAIVVVHHIPGYFPGNPSFPFVLRRLDAMVCVLIFYIISGFYMSLVINEKYSKAPNFPGSFYASRAMRIFPLYWIILVLFYAFDVGTEHLGNVGNIRGLSGFAWFAQVFMNVTTLGLDLVPSLGGYTFQLIGPAWSLGSELLFYLLAPWLVRLSWQRSVALVLMTFAIRLALYHLGFDRYPLRVLFFPLSLGFFLLGHLAYLILARIERTHWFASSTVKYLVGLLSLGAIMGSGFLLDVGGGIDPDTLNLWAFYLIIMLLIPTTFIGLRHSRADRLLGDLSFPLYISHTLVLTFVAHYVIGSQQAQRIIALSLAILFSVLLTLAIEMPIERARAAIGAWIMRRQQPRSSNDLVSGVSPDVNPDSQAAEAGAAQ